MTGVGQAAGINPNSMIYPQYEGAFNELCPPSWGEALASWTDFKNVSLGQVIANIPSNVARAFCQIPSLVTSPLRFAAYLIYGETEQEAACRSVKEGNVSLSTVDPLGRTELTKALAQNNIGAAKVYLLGSDLLQRDINYSSVLHHAANTNTPGAMQYFEGVNVNAKDEAGQTAAHIAAAAGNAEGLAYLVAAGAKLNEMDAQGRTPLMLAAQSSAECFFMLLAHNPILTRRDAMGRGLWHYAALNPGNTNKITSELFLQKVPLNPDKMGRTPLHYAALAGNRVAAGDLLYYYGAQSSPDFNGITPAHLAAFQGHKRLIDELHYYEQSLSEVDQLGRTPLHWAAANGHYDAASALLAYHGEGLDALERNFKTALHLAAENNHPELVALFLANGANTRLIPNNHQSALYVAAKHGHQKVVELLREANAPMIASHVTLPLHEAIANRNYADLQVAILSGSDLNVRDSDGQTPLMLSLAMNQEPLAISLMDAGADVRLVDNNKMTALHLAGLCAGEQLVKHLLHYGADPFAKDIRNQLPLHCAAAVGNIEAITALASHTQSKEYGIDIPSNHGSTPLHLATLENHPQAVALLCQLGATPLVVDNNQRTSIHLAAMEGRDDLLRLFLAKDAIGINWEDKDMRTALYYAGAGGHENAIQFLISQGGTAFPEEQDDLQRALLKVDPNYLKNLLKNNSPMVISDVYESGFHKVFAIGDTSFTAALSPMLAGSSLLHSKSAQQQTLLHAAAKGNDFPAMLRLMDLQVPLNDRDTYGNAALHYVAETGNMEALNEFARRGASLIPQNLNGLTPLEIALERGHYDFADRLRTLGGRILFGNKLQNGEVAVALLEMILSGNYEDVNTFLLEGARLSVTDHLGRGALHYAALSDKSKDFIDLLIAGGLDLNNRDYQGRTALHEAVSARNLGAVQALLAHKANPFIKDKNEVSAFMEAGSCGNKALENLFYATEK